MKIVSIGGDIMEMKFNENEERNEILKRRINQVLENWRGLMPKKEILQKSESKSC